MTLRFASCIAILAALILAAAPLRAQNVVVPTAPNGTSNNFAASTAFVQNAFAGGSPLGCAAFPALAGAVTTAGATCATVAANIPWSAVTATPTTFSGYGIVSTLPAGQLPAFGSGDVSFAAAGGAGTIAALAVTNAKRAVMQPSTVSCNPTAGAGVPQDCLGPGLGVAMMIQNPSQSGGSPWKVIDPFGATINTSGTVCQGWDSLVAAAKLNGWPWYLGAGNITCTAPVPIPMCFGRSEWIDVGAVISFTAQGAATLVAVDSHENCDSLYLGQFVQHSGDTGVVVDLIPSTMTPPGNVGFFATRFELGTAAPATGGIALRLNPTTGGLVGNMMTFRDLNGGTTCLQLLNPGTAFIPVQDNQFFHGYYHACTARVVQWGTGTTNQSTLRRNDHFFSKMEPGAGASAGFETWANHEQYYGINIDNEIANATLGIKTNSGADGNNFWGGSVAATTNLSDGGKLNQFNGVAGISNANVFASLPTCTAALAGTSKPITNSTSATFGATITGGGANFVTALCDGTNWTVH